MSADRIARRLADGVTVDGVRTALAAIPEDATVAVSGFGSVGYPKTLPGAIADSDREFSLTVISGGSVGGEIDETLVETGAIARRFPYQAQQASRDAINRGEIHFHDRHVAGLSDEVGFGHLSPVDVAIVEAIAVGKGWFSPSMSIGPVPSYVESADRVIVELNRAQPLSLQAFHDIYQQAAPPNREPVPLTEPGGRIGGPKVTFDHEKLVAVVESNAPDSPYEFREPAPADLEIADNLADFLLTEIDRNPAFAETINLQFGVGSLGNALMGAFKTVDFGTRSVNYYGEVIQDGLLDMIDAGNLQAASAASLALSEEGRKRLVENIDRYRDAVVLRPSSISNGPELINRFAVVGVNSALEVDCYGHANSTHVRGTHVMNGIGGSGDFLRNSLVGVVALQSTAKGGEISRIVPMVPHVDHTEHDFSVVVTEHGVADLRGLSPRERARTLVENCAHPDYRPDLRAYLNRAAVEGGHVPHDLETALNWRTD